MKAKIKNTDVVIRVEPLYSVDGLHIEQFVNIENGDLYQPHNLDLISNNIDWESLRNQAAIAAMQGILSNSDAFKQYATNEEYKKMGDVTKVIALSSCMYADALIEELKKK